MNPDIFEVIMLICFGAAWPFSICRMIKTKESQGKSLKFLIIVLIGYVSGIFFQYYSQRNNVIYLYILNALMVSIDLALTVRYSKNLA